MRRRLSQVRHRLSEMLGVDEVLEKVDLLRMRNPEALPPKHVKVVYAEEKDVWVLK